jgi:hypothetical protein
MPIPQTKLDSWKEIAAYIQRDVRTAMRWEKDRGLPVYRVPGGKRGAVYAYEAELQDWLQNIDRPSAVQSAPLPRKPIRIRPAAAFALGAILLAFSAFASIRAYVNHQRVPARITITENGIVAWDAEGRYLWDYPVGYRITPPMAKEAGWRTQIVDLDGDGRPEVLFAATTINQPTGYGQEELFCVSSQGKLLWRYKPDIQTEFNATGLNGPWRFAQMLTVPDGRSRSIWLVVDHAVRWSAFVMKISPDGKSGLQFVDSGIIYALQTVTTSAGSFVLAGGVNNEYRAASLAILRAEGPPATSPQSSGAKEKCIRGCPAGSAWRYLLFPPSELNRASLDPYNGIDVIHALEGRGATIDVTELTIPSTVKAVYQLSDQMRPESVIYGDGYNGIHRQFEREGRLTHLLKDCQERRHPVPIRIWEEKSGWQTIEVNWPGSRLD